MGTFRRMVSDDFGIELPGSPTRSARWYEGSVADGRGTDAVLSCDGRLAAQPVRRAPIEAWHMVFPGRDHLRRSGHRTSAARIVDAVGSVVDARPRA